jgi:hypothetical protein
MGLIDEYEFVVHPRLAGHGPRLFASFGRIMEQLRLIQWKYSDPTGRIRSNVVSATCYW